MANKNNTSFPSCTVTITLTPEARNFLAGTTAGVSHFAIYNDLLDNMAIVDTSFSKRGNIVPLLTGQAESSAHSMSERWKLGRKSMVRILSTMDDLGIIRLHTSRLASISDMLSVDKCQTNDGDICYPDFSNLPPDPQSDEQVQNAEPPTDGTTDNLPTATVPEAKEFAKIYGVDVVVSAYDIFYAGKKKGSQSKIRNYVCVTFILELIPYGKEECQITRSCSTGYFT